VDLRAYLDRIGYGQAVRTDFETLRGVMRAHGRSIPYENLDVLLGRRIGTDPRAAYEKLVTRQRGGWCYEMNGTLGLALQEIGFDVTRLCADGSTPASHLVLAVELEGKRYIVDAGFVDGPPEPYLVSDGELRQDGFEFRIERFADGRWRLYNHRFGMAPGFIAGGPNESAMSERCVLLQTEPQSPFVQNAIVARRTADGVTSLIGRVLRSVRPDSVDKQLIDSADQYVATLEDRFSLKLPGVASLWPSICARHEQVMAEQAARRQDRG
jgi:N-hydroxyarylamine O-acetyltransferase